MAWSSAEDSPDDLAMAKHEVHPIIAFIKSEPSGALAVMLNDPPSTTGGRLTFSVSGHEAYERRCGSRMLELNQAGIGATAATREIHCDRDARYDRQGSRWVRHVKWFGPRGTVSS